MSYHPQVGDRVTDDDLTPAERMARTVAVAQLRRGEAPTTNIAVVLALGLLRLLGDLDDNYEPHTQKEHP